MTPDDTVLLMVIAVGCLLGYLVGLCVAVVARWCFGWTRSRDPSHSGLP